MVEEEILDDFPVCSYCGEFNLDYQELIDEGECEIQCGSCEKIYLTNGTTGNVIFTSRPKEVSL